MSRELEAWKPSSTEFFINIQDNSITFSHLSTNSISFFLCNNNLSFVCCDCFNISLGEALKPGGVDPHGFGVFMDVEIGICLTLCSRVINFLY